jgi:hypothetical protein
MAMINNKISFNVTATQFKKGLMSTGVREKNSVDITQVTKQVTNTLDKRIYSEVDGSSVPFGWLE